MGATIFLVEDEPAIRELIRLTLEPDGFRCREFASAELAAPVLAEELPDLILLDWMLPGRSGLELARELKQRSRTRSIPLILLTAKALEEDKIRGLDIGADDYITKPFSPRELIARIRAVLRRTRPEQFDRPIELDGLVLDPVRHQVSAAGHELDLSPTEFRLLHYLITHPERAFSRAQLLDAVWPDNLEITERAVDVSVRRLRQALEASGHDRFLQTVRGVGYRFSARG